MGSAWTNTSEESKAELKSDSGLVINVDIKENEKLLAKAKAQGMNTDTRRNIFCILMTAEV